MAARYKTAHTELSREKIRTTQLIKRLQDNALAPQEFLTANQVRSIEILLRKSVPDLSATEIKGDVASFVMRLPEPIENVKDWEERVRGERPTEH